MGASSYGYVIIGIRLDNKALQKAIKDQVETTKRTVRGCNHEVPETSKYCPECGKFRLIEIKSPEMSESQFLSSLGFQNDYYTNREVICSTDGRDTFVTIGKYCAKTDDINGRGGYDSIEIPTEEAMQELKAKLKARLEPYGLWNASNFKIWVVGYCSY